MAAAASAPLGDALTSLALSSTRLHPDDLPLVVASEAAKLGVSSFTIYLADMEQRLLVALLPPGADPIDPLSIDGTLAGRAYRTQRPVTVPGPSSDEGSNGGGAAAWLPLLDSAERIGVVSFCLDEEPEALVLGQLAAFTNVVGEIVANKAEYGDVIIRGRRTQEMTLAAEMRWTVLPPLTFTGRNLTISGIVEPAYEIAGDTFDYAVNGDTAHIAIIDAVGHGLEAARIANLAVSAYRHGRRRDLDLIETYRAMDETISDQFGHEKFATAQLATLSISSGELRWLNAGHPAPMVIRQGHRLDLAAEVCLPIGLSHSHDGDEPKVAATALQPGDNVLFFSDGVVEARSVEGEEFGRDRLGHMAVRALASGQEPAETMRLLGHAILAHQLGVLQDDATLLLLVWHGPPAERKPPGA